MFVILNRIVEYFQLLFLNNFVLFRKVGRKDGIFQIVYVLNNFFFLHNLGSAMGFEFQ